ncbi:hypothetical protein TNCV_4429781 [Trichonephila clavipes]|nr:hypothetical protein TNCV_4429781 [Trichonephila clavipes]
MSTFKDLRQGILLQRGQGLKESLRASPLNEEYLQRHGLEFVTRQPQKRWLQEYENGLNSYNTKTKSKSCQISLVMISVSKEKGAIASHVVKVDFEANAQK